MNDNNAVVAYDPVNSKKSQGVTHEFLAQVRDILGADPQLFLGYSKSKQWDGSFHETVSLRINDKVDLAITMNTRS